MADDKTINNIKRMERLIALTQQSGWDDLVKILDMMWEDAYEVVMSAELQDGGIEQIMGARATMKIIIKLIGSINGQIDYGERLKEKSKPIITR